MARECISNPRLTPRLREHAGDPRMPWNNNRENGPIELMDFSIGKFGCEGPNKRPTVWVKVGGIRIKAIVDTVCTQALIQTELAPREWTPKADAVQMICMHEQPSMYQQRKYMVKVLGRTREMPVGLARDLLYPTILAETQQKFTRC